MSTTTMSLPAAPGALARLAGPVGTVALRLVQVIRAFKNRRDLENLAALDDRMLADIGLTRADLRDAVAEPLWRDPSAILVTRWRERRGSRAARRIRPANPLVASPSVIPGHALDRDGATSQVTTRYY